MRAKQTDKITCIDRRLASNLAALAKERLASRQATNHRTYAQRRIAKGLCRRCGVERDSTGTRTLCRICADKMKQNNRAWLKSERPIYRSWIVAGVEDDFETFLLLQQDRMRQAYAASMERINIARISHLTSRQMRRELAVDTRGTVPAGYQNPGKCGASA